MAKKKAAEETKEAKSGAHEKVEAPKIPRLQERYHKEILPSLAETLGHKPAYDSLAQVRRRLAEIAPTFRAVDHVTPAEWSAFGAAGTVDAAPFAMPIANYYMTDPISRASRTMAECVAEIVEGKREAA